MWGRRGAISFLPRSWWLYFPSLSFHWTSLCYSAFYGLHQLPETRSHLINFFPSPFLLSRHACVLPDCEGPGNVCWMNELNHRVFLALLKDEIGPNPFLALGCLSLACVSLVRVWISPYCNFYIRVPANCWRNAKWDVQCSLVLLDPFVPQI